MVSLKGEKAYLDANTVIYSVEGYENYSNLKDGLLQPLEKGEFVAVTSAITLVETIVGPRKAGDLATEADFRDFLTPSENFVIEPVTAAVLESVIDLRVRFGLKMPDAIHLATGMISGCTVFVSNDLEWSKVGVTVVKPKDLG